MSRPEAPLPAQEREERLSLQGAWLVLGTLAALALVAVPELGSDPWRFRAGAIHPHGVLGPIVRAAGRHWDLGFVRTPGVLAALGLAVLAVVLLRAPRLRLPVVSVALVGVVAALLVPALLLQVGLRRSTAPWFYTNDSTYQIEIAGDLVQRGDDPYGYDYAATGLARWYSRDGTVAPATNAREVALRHFAYFPGTALAAAAWRWLPRPLDDFRFLVALATAALALAALAFPGPLAWRLALGAVLAANPLAIRAVWFGTADGPSLLALALAFALLLRRRLALAGAVLAVAILLKQFALVALPFFAVLALKRHRPRALLGAAAAFAAVLAWGFLPFLIADPGALWADTIRYGTSTYPIIGYGLAHLLLEAGAVDDAFGSYPFGWLALLVWAPVTAWLLWAQARSRSLWVGAFGFTVSIFLLLFLARVFQTSYLVWPLTGLAVTGLVAAAERARALETPR